MKEAIDINTPAELYEYCKKNGAENWEIVILKKESVDKEKGLWLITGQKQVLIVI